MLHLEGNFTSTDQLKLYYQCWYPRNEVKAVVGLVHGLGSHSGWFSPVVNTLLSHNYAAYSFDLRGHGKSSGQRGYINNWQEFRNDLNCFWQLILRQNQTKPCFLLGHSLGGVIVLDYALFHPSLLSGIILIAPAMGKVGVSPLKLTIAKILAQIWPRFTLNTGIPENVGSGDRQFLSVYNNDPLRHTKGTARLVTELSKTTQLIQKNACSLQSPMLILQGSEDMVALPESTRLFVDKLCVMDREYREYAKAYHDLHNDIYSQKVINDIIDWLDKKVRKNLEFRMQNLE